MRQRSEIMPGKVQDLGRDKGGVCTANHSLQGAPLSRGRRGEATCSGCAVNWWQMAADLTWLGTEDNVPMLSLRMWGTWRLLLMHRSCSSRGLALLQPSGRHLPSLASTRAEGISGSCQRWLAATVKSLVPQTTSCRFVCPPGPGPWEVLTGSSSHTLERQELFQERLMTPLANRASWDLQALGLVPGSARGFLGVFSATTPGSGFSDCKMETTNIIFSFLFICSTNLRAVHVLGWILLPVSLRSMQGILGAPPQDKTVRTTITARSWHRRGEDCFQPSQPMSVGTNDRYNWASGFFFTFICLGKDVSSCSQPLC